MKLTKKLADAIRRMESDSPQAVVDTIEQAGYVVVPRSRLVELSRAWEAFNDDEDGQYDRLGRAVMKVLDIPETPKARALRTSKGVPIDELPQGNRSFGSLTIYPESPERRARRVLNRP